MPDNLESRATKHVVLVIRESLTRSNDNGIASVSAKWIEVLHVAANDSILSRRKQEA